MLAPSLKSTPTAQMNWPWKLTIYHLWENVDILQGSSCPWHQKYPDSSIVMEGLFVKTYVIIEMLIGLTLLKRGPTTAQIGQPGKLIIIIIIELAKRVYYYHHYPYSIRGARCFHRNRVCRPFLWWWVRPTPLGLYPIYIYDIPGGLDPPLVMTTCHLISTSSREQ